MKHIFKGVFGNTRAFDEYYAELRSLNVIGEIFTLLKSETYLKEVAVLKTRSKKSIPC